MGGNCLQLLSRDLQACRNQQKEYEDKYESIVVVATGREVGIF